MYSLVRASGNRTADLLTGICIDLAGNSPFVGSADYFPLLPYGAIVLAGSFFGQYLDIRKNGRALREKIEGLTSETACCLEDMLPKNSNSLNIRYLRDLLAHRDNPAQMRRILADYEIAADKDLSTSRTLTKLGPMLGLMGTLIPMGPALVGLSTGDISSMAYNMQVAFATTVVGLFASAVGFLTQQTKNRWYMQDMTNMEFVAELLGAGEGK